MKEFHRVCKPGGVVAVCDASAAIVVTLRPDLPGIREYWKRAVPAMQRLGLNPKAGDQLEEYARVLRFARIEFRKGILSGISCKIRL